MRFAAVALIAALLAVSASAQSLLTTGTCGDHQYKIYSQPGCQFTDAQNQASALGSGWEVTTITDQAETDCIANMIRPYEGSEFWIGMSRTGVNSPANWKWIDGEGYCYRNWNAGEPNGDGYNGIVYGGTTSRLGKWNDEGYIPNLTGFILEWGPHIYTGSFCCPFVLDQCDSTQAVCDNINSQLTSMQSACSADPSLQPICTSASSLHEVCLGMVANCHSLHDSTCC